MYEVLDWKINKCESLKNYLRRFVRKYIFGQVSSGQKDGGLSAAVMCSAVMCPAAKWVDTHLLVYESALEAQVSYSLKLVHVAISRDYRSTVKPCCYHTRLLSMLRV